MKIIKRIYNHISSSINLKITFITGLCLIIFLGVLLGVNYFGMRELKTQTLDQADKELTRLVEEYYVNYIDIIDDHVTMSLDNTLNEIHILSNIMQTFFSNKSAMTALIEQLKESTYFEDKLQAKSNYFQNTPDEPTSVFVASYMIENGQIVEKAKELIDDTLILDLILPAFAEYGVDKLQAYFQGGENKEIFRLSPWANIGEDVVDVYPHIFDQPIWEAFNPGLADAWRQWLISEPENLNDMLRITPPVQDGLTGDLVLTISQPVANEDYTDFEGTLSYDVPIGNIVSLVEQVKISESGFAFLTQSNGNVFAINPHGLEIFGLLDDSDATIDSVSGFNKLERFLIDSPYGNIKNLRLSNTEETVIKPIVINGEKYLLASKNLLNYQSWSSNEGFFDETWQIGFLAPHDEVFKMYKEIEDDMTRETARINVNIILVMVLLAVVILFLVHKIITIVTGELISLATTVNEAKEKNYDIDFNVSATDEVGILANAFKEMLDEIRLSFDKMELQNSELKREIEERKQKDRIIDYLENFDSSTDLPNKKALLSILKDIKGEKEYFVSLVVIGLDEFRKVNEAYSWTFGDKLMQEIAKRIRKSLPEDSFLFKLSGDEFAFILKEKRLKNLISVVEDVNNVFHAPFFVEKHEVTISSSLGVSSYPYDSQEPLDIFKFASNAMIHAKEVNKGHYEFYNEDMNSTARMRLEMINELRTAVDDQEFELYYQPIINLESMQISGVEALIRWDNKNLGRISPNVFIPLAEKTKYILSIGDWVYKQALSDMKKLHMDGHMLNVAINVSIIQFLENNFVENLIETIRDVDIDPSYVTIEITEGLFINDVEKILDVLNELKRFGIAISVDDFGTGYSSLSYIKNLPLNKLKIDRSFINELNVDKSSKLVSGIISLAHSLNLSLVAEGIETIDQLDFIKERSCQEAQGYYFSKPVPYENLKEYLTKK